MIDLHAHTRHSDGERTRAELLAEALAAGVEVLSVTDHDTVSGVAECRAAALAVGVRYLGSEKGQLKMSSMYKAA